MKNKPIGLFDSGVGGLAILKTLKTSFPKQSFIYLADTLNLPYGEKTPASLQTICENAMEFLLSKDVSTIVIACNTASTLFLERQSFKNIPLINVISPKIEKILSKNIKSIGVIATSHTVRSQMYPHELHKINPELKVFQQASPSLTTYVEQGQIEESHEALKNYLAPLLDKKIDLLILGCTHYLFLKEEIKKILPSSIPILTIEDEITQLVSSHIQSDEQSFIRLFCNKNIQLFTERAHALLGYPDLEIEELKPYPKNCK